MTRPPGRPPLPESQRRVEITLSLDPYIAAVLEMHASEQGPRRHSALAEVVMEIGMKASGWMG